MRSTSYIRVRDTGRPWPRCRRRRRSIVFDSTDKNNCEDFKRNLRNGVFH